MPVKLILLGSIVLFSNIQIIYSEEDVWIEQELAGDDVPLSERYSYSREEEESPAFEFLKSLREIAPRTFSGELTFRTRQNEREHSAFDITDYWYERFIARMNWGKESAECGALALRRFGEPGVSGNSYFKYHLKKVWLKVDNLFGNNTFLLGNYRVQYGQGLVFYGSLLEFSRPIGTSWKGLRVERGTNPNAYLNGFGWQYEGDRFLCSAFVSRSWLSADLNSEGNVDENMYGLKEDYGLLETESQREKWRSFFEDLAGGHISYHVDDRVDIGLSGYEAYYSRTVNPSGTEDYYTHVLRGRRNTVGGIDWLIKKDVFSFSGEYAVSKARGEGILPQKGYAWAVTPKIVCKPWIFFLTGYDYDPAFYNRHAQGPSFNNTDPNNQKGLLYGIRYKRKPHMLFVTYRSAQTTLSEWTGSARSTSPRYPADMKEIYGEYRIFIIKTVEVVFRMWNDYRDRYLDIDSSAAAYFIQTGQERKRTRGEITWTPSKKFRYRIRYDNRIEKIPLKGEKLSGDLIFGEILYKPFDAFSIGFRETVFDSGATYLSQYEPVWYGIHQSNNFFSQEGMRTFIVLKFKMSRYLIWIRYGRTELTDGTIRDDFRLQTDIYF